MIVRCVGIGSVLSLILRTGSIVACGPKPKETREPCYCEAPTRTDPVPFEENMQIADSMKSMNTIYLNAVTTDPPTLDAT